MGLAASQARFLAITSRKMNCEFQSMQLAQEKLSITRDLQKASQDYQSAISASKLVWETEDGSVYDVTYDTMMQPSVLNEYDPYLLTDAKGRIVLNKSSFDAAVAAGVIDAQGNPNGNYTAGTPNSLTDGSRNAFLNQLGIKNQIAPAVTSMIMDLGDAWYTQSGVGGPIFDKTMAGIMSTSTFIDYLTNTIKLDDNKNEYPAFTLLGKSTGPGTYENLGTESFSTKFHTSTKINRDPSKGAVDTEKYMIMNKGKVLSEGEIANLTLGQILTGDYTVSYINPNEAVNSTGDLDLILDFLKMTLQGNANNPGILNTDSIADAALGHAYNFTLSLYSNNKATKIPNNSADLYQAIAGDTASGATNNAIVHYGGAGTVTSASLTNMLNSYLTYFAIALEGYEQGLVVNKDSAALSTYVTEDFNYSFAVNSSSAVSEQDALNADFYNMLYNNLCMYGACTDEVMQEQVMDPEYLSYALKNGQMFISSLHDDGYFYQGHYTQNGHVGEVPDQDAIARAELEYEMTKSKLNYKEENIELKMKNLDMEISSLSTEFDTVKNLISKNIEKVFTMFNM